DFHARKVENRLPRGAVLQIGIVDRAGMLVYSNLGTPQRTYLGDREHIKVHLNGGPDHLFISAPVLGRVSKQWTIQFSYPIRRGNRLEGVAVVSLSTTYLKDALVAVTLGTNDTIAVFRQSGEYLGRNLDHEKSLGKRAPPDRPFIGEAASASGQLRVVSNFDGTPRLYRWQRLAEFPVTVVIGLSENSLLAPAEHMILLDRRNAVLGTVALWGFGLAVALLFFSLLRQQRLVNAAKEQLEQRVAERTAQLEAANKELADFSYSVSHDLRSPLRAVAGFAKILEDDMGENLGEEGRRMVRAIQQAGLRMGRLTDGLLDYLSLSRKTLQRSRLDMNQLAAEAFGREAGGDRRPNFRAGELPPALGDAALVREVFGKLLSNAIRFSSAKPDACIEVGGIIGSGENTYFVRDNGIGFDMQYESKLFCVFERLHSEAALMGTGIGLAIVKRIVERHGGRVWAEGKVGEGATFYFTLPAADAI
ncbi:MAG: ATP-binding protein, partial [Ignavibacteria bacterium]